MYATTPYLLAQLEAALAQDLRAAHRIVGCLVRRRVPWWVIVERLEQQLTLPQHILADDPVEGHNIKAALDLKAHLPHGADVDLQLAVAIEHARGLNRERLNFAVGDGGVVDLGSHHPLHIRSDDSLVGEDHLVAHRLEDREHILARDEELADGVKHLVDVDRAELEDRVTVEVDHGRHTPS